MSSRESWENSQSYSADAHLQEQPQPPSTRSELEIPQELEQVILDCLEKDPGKRPQSAQELTLRLSQSEKSVRRWNNERAEHWWRTHLPQPSPSHVRVGTMAHSSAAAES